MSDQFQLSARIDTRLNNRPAGEPAQSCYTTPGADPMLNKLQEGTGKMADVMRDTLVWTMNGPVQLGMAIVSGVKLIIGIGQFASQVAQNGLRATVGNILNSLKAKPPSTSNEPTPIKSGGNEPEPSKPTPPEEAPPPINPNGTPAEIAKQVIERTGGSVKSAINELNQLNLPQDQVGKILTEVFKQTNREIGGIITLENGTQVMLPAKGGFGPNKPIITIDPSGQARFGFGTIGPNYEDPNNPVSVFDITYP